jgi:hypothetical protein
MAGMHLEFDPEPLRAKQALDVINPTMSDMIDQWLDRLEDDPSQALVRRSRLHSPVLWLIVVRAPDGDDYAILWDIDGDAVVIHYIGPDVFH